MRGYVGRAGAVTLALWTATSVATAQPLTWTKKTPAYAFAYTIPRAAGDIAPLRRWLERDQAGFRRRFTAEAEADYAEMRRAKDRDFFAYDGRRTWKVVAQTPRLLSLSNETYLYTGGAHGRTLIDSFVWDKARATLVEPTAFFSSPALLQRVLGARWCAWLARERARRLGGPVAKDPTFPCPKIAELTLLLGSTDRRAIDRVGLIAGQYVAGSYAEGMYEMTVPVTPELLAAVRPEWRGVFRVQQ
ncbi:DUF4163 domain-containing protein [Sphingomonas sp. BK235]|uniref:DUF4163 domain-containing protein n=1 Tax=Sphingomonas sp. BK235 TaxID=2512131 RepID=UPI00104A8B82|nr:DUF4163 domain-containing protein [Sphingomonas sp. BK235]TCP34630.1 uncharacterized protein DUF4163 [Sphingomonas sp. BK235]